VDDLEPSFIVVILTTGSKEEAEKITRQLLDNKLIACGNIVGPIVSLFHWSGKIESSEEYLILMKSRADLFEKLTEMVKSLHSYEVPEIIAVPVVKGSSDYLEWVSKCLI
jgi:periplasmic divalent cation tolerance protein